METVFPVMGWLTKIMDRNETVAVFLTRFFGGTFSGPVPVARSTPQAALRREYSSLNVYVKIWSSVYERHPEL